jgi:hypothetical protein
LIYFRLSSLCYLADSIDRRERLGLKPLRITLIHIILVSDLSGLSRRNLLLRLICSAEIYLLRRTRSIAVLLILSWSFHRPRLGSDRFLVRSINLSTSSGCPPPSRSDQCPSKEKQTKDIALRAIAPDGRGRLGSSEARPRPRPVATHPRAWRSRARHSGPAHWPRPAIGIEQVARLRLTTEMVWPPATVVSV